jgi:DNA (cytosine-5)-methyltransferase 1
VGADDIGANHRRKRAWILAYAAGELDGGRPTAPRAISLGAERSTGRGPGLDGQGHGAHADREGQYAGAGDAEAMGRLASPGGAAGTNAADAHQGRRHEGADRLAPRDGIGIREAAATVPWAHWNGGPPGADVLDDGVSAGLDYASAQAAYGDAVVPQITEAIARTIIRLDSILFDVSDGGSTFRSPESRRLSDDLNVSVPPFHGERFAQGEAQ